jgi:XRE family transcriptional regulator, regulator of sulfur utilization
MPTLRERLGRRVKYLRDQKKWTQELLGEKAGLTYKYIGQIERAEVSPSLETVEKLAKAFGLGMDKLLSFERRGSGKTREDLFQEVSKREVESVKRAIDVLRRVFGKD